MQPISAVPEVEIVVVNPLVVKIKTAARMMGITSQTIYDWLRDGKIKSVQVGQRHGIEVAELQRYINEHRSTEFVTPPDPEAVESHRALRAIGVKKQKARRAAADDA